MWAEGRWGSAAGGGEERLGMDLSATATVTVTATAAGHCHWPHNHTVPPRILNIHNTHTLSLDLRVAKLGHLGGDEGGKAPLVHTLPLPLHQRFHVIGRGVEVLVVGGVEGGRAGGKWGGVRLTLGGGGTHQERERMWVCGLVCLWESVRGGGGMWRMSGADARRRAGGALDRVLLVR